MIVYDLSHSLKEGCPVYPGDPVFSCTQVANVEQHQYNMASLSMGSHTGTHIDAPYHFYNDGKRIDELDLSLLIGPAAVVDVRGKNPRETITWDDLSPFEPMMKRCRILLVHTGWSEHWGTSTYFDHPFLGRTAAERIVASGVKVLGVDMLNPDQTMVDGSAGDYSVHEVVLGAGCVIAENLTNLEHLPPQDVTVSLLPLNLAGCDGSPVRAVAWTTA